MPSAFRCPPALKSRMRGFRNRRAVMRNSSTKNASAMAFCSAIVSGWSTRTAMSSRPAWWRPVRQTRSSPAPRVPIPPRLKASAWRLTPSRGALPLGFPSSFHARRERCWWRIPPFMKDPMRLHLQALRAGRQPPQGASGWNRAWRFFPSRPSATRAAPFRAAFVKR